MAWSGLDEAEHVRGDSREAESRDASGQASVEAGAGGKKTENGRDDSAGDEQQQPPHKRRKIASTQDSNHCVGGEGGETGANGNANGNENGNANDSGSGSGSSNGHGNAPADPDAVPYFKPGIPDPDDKGENECFFVGCTAKSGGNQYFV